MGNLLVTQSGGPTAVINASLTGVIKAALGKVDRIYGAIHGIEGVIRGNFVDLTDDFSTELSHLSLSHTPSSFLGSCRYKLKDEEDFVKIFANLKKLNIKYFICIGGNDSMDTVNKLAKHSEKYNEDVKVVGVPKTIDNDLAITDHTPGFGSAAKYVATSMKEIILDSYVYDKKTITIVEIMGRNAGWLTASSCLARQEGIVAPHFIYLPEVVFYIEKFLSDLGLALEKYRNVVIAVSEGVKTADGKYVFDYTDDDPTERMDSFGHMQLSGTAATLARLAKKEFGIKPREIEFSLLQRSAAHLASRTDRDEAVAVGIAGTEAALAGKTGIMMYFKRLPGAEYKIEICEHPVNEIANAEKTVPLEWIVRDGTDVSQELVEYLKPLVAGETTTLFREGMPVYSVRSSKNTVNV